MSYDIVCYYADIGLDYADLLRNLTASARRHVPAARSVILTPTPGCQGAEGFDTKCPMPLADDTNLCYRRAEAIASWGARAVRPFVIVDADIEFRSAPAFGNWDIGLMWRGNAAQPINTGMILSRAGQSQFWRDYLRVAYSLPKPLRAWWGDQLPFSLMSGIFHQAGDTLTISGSTVKLLEMDRLCPKSSKPHPAAWALHFKGRALKSKFAAGTSSPESASSMDIAEAPNSGSAPAALPVSSVEPLRTCA